MLSAPKGQKNPRPRSNPMLASQPSARQPGAGGPARLPRRQPGPQTGPLPGSAPAHSGAGKAQGLAHPLTPRRKMSSDRQEEEINVILLFQTSAAQGRVSSSLP